MPPTTNATTTPPALWEPPDRVMAVLDQIGDATEGYVTLSMFDAQGSETQRLKDQLDEVGDPPSWLLAEVETVVHAQPGEYTHMRVRLWAAGGNAIAQSKFRLPTAVQLPPPPERFVPSPQLHRIGTARPPAAKPKSRPDGTPGTSPPSTPPRTAPPPDSPDRLRADRLQALVDTLRERLDASQNHVRALEAALRDVAEERDDASSNYELLLAGMQALGEPSEDE